MKKYYIYLFISFLFAGSVAAQTTETFETETDNSTSFIDNNQVFNISSQSGGTFDIANYTGKGWNGTAIDNKSIDNSTYAFWDVPVQFTISSAGQAPFTLKSLNLYLSRKDLTVGSGSLTITGKLNGTTVFSATSSSGFNTNLGVKNGFTLIDLTSFGSANNSNVAIDQFVVSTTGSFEYVSLDAMTWNIDCSTLVAPTSNAQAFCVGATVADLVATGSSLKWYAAATGGSPLTSTTILSTGTYYVTSSNVAGCESARIATSVTVNTTAAPTANAQSVCANATVANLVATGTSLKWYVSSTGGSPLDSTTNLSAGNYYVSQTLNGCESTRTTVTVSITSAPQPVRNGNSGTLCNGATVATLNTLYNNSSDLLWYSIPTGGTPLDLSTTILPMSTNVTFYVTLTTNGCESPRLVHNAYVNNVSSPTASPTQSFCTGAKVSNLVATPAPLASLQWFTTSTGGTALTGTTMLSSTDYYAGQNHISGCPSDRTKVTVTLTPNTINSTSLWVCDSYYWAFNGVTYTESGTYVAVNGCDTEILDLTINPSTSDTTTISACGSYTWELNDMTYTESGIYTVINDCDTQILNLTITPSTSTTTTASACDSYFWSVNEMTYTESGTYTVVNGCDTQILELTITPSTSTTTTASACDSYFWLVNEMTYTESGTYTVVNGCDTQILELTITPSTSTTTTASACDIYFWSVNEMTYSESGTYTVVNGCDTQILDLTITPSTSTTTTASACDSYFWSVNEMTYTESGTYTVVNGCDTQILDLTITPSTSTTTTASACDSYFWSVNEMTYAESGTYTVVNGCDTQILELTITPSTSTTATASACDSYFWSVNEMTYTESGTYTIVNGCDTQILNLTITPSTSTTTEVISCNSYLWIVTGQFYSQTGTYTVVNGCDTQILNLTINGIIDNTVTDNGTYLSAVQTSGATYQWVDCNSNQPIVGATDFIFTPVQTGNYEVVISANGCSVTSDCFPMTVLANAAFDTINFSYAPNPTSGVLNIKYSKEISQVNVTNILGQLVMSQNTHGTEVQIDLSALPSEAYLVKVVSEGTSKTIKVIKKD